MFSGELITPDRLSYHTGPRHAAVVDNLWAPLATFVDRRADAAADNLSARHCCCVLLLLQFSMIKKGHQNIFRIERNFFGNIWKQFWPPTPRRAAANFLGPTGRRRRPKLTAADTMTLTHDSNWAAAVIIIILSIISFVNLMLLCHLVVFQTSIW